MQEIYYINHINQKLNLLESPYRLKTGDFFKFEWDYESTSNINQFGGKITRFNRNIREKSFNLNIQARTKALYYEALNEFLEVTELDVLNKRPGKLYIGDQYLSCYLIENEKTTWENGQEFLQCEITLVTEYPFWVTENKQTFMKQEIISSDNKFYPYKYPYRYANGLTDKTITNNNFVASNMQIAIYGETVNPLLVIGTNTYQVNTTILNGEYLLIDTADRTITKIQNNGNKVNMFNSRNKEYNVFSKIEPGNQPLKWDGSFPLEITIYNDRSEPKWIL